jgi:hypothetical protein
MLKEIKIEKIEREESKRVIGRGYLPCYCGDGAGGRCGLSSTSNYLFDQNKDKDPIT